MWGGGGYGHGATVATSWELELRGQDRGSRLGTCLVTKPQRTERVTAYT